jgi:hypothetical protein
MNADHTSKSSTPSKSLIPILVLLLVVIIGISIVGKVSFFGHRGEKIETLSPGEEKRTAAPGKVVSSFPQELLIENDAVVADSYSIQYAGANVNQPVVRYVSKKTMGDNVTLFRERLVSQGWTITHEANPAEAPTFFYAYKDKAQINILLAPDANGQVTVTVAYASQG